MIRDGGRRVGQVLAGLVSFSNPGLIVIGGGVAGIGHVLLAEIRGVVYSRSLPLATGNMPIVLSELGGEAGVVGAAWLISDHVFSAREASEDTRRGADGPFRNRPRPLARRPMCYVSRRSIDTDSPQASHLVQRYRRTADG